MGCVEMKRPIIFWTVCVICFWLGGCQIPPGQSAEANLKTLKLVQLVFRHGDKAPDHPYPNDPFKDESIWPEGWAQLTNEGKQMQYKLGQYLRTRYGNFLNASYVPNQVYALSSETERTMMSALLVLAGLYPSSNESNWDSAVKWQPIPVRTIFQRDDNLIGNNRSCPRFSKLYNENMRNHPELKKLNGDNKRLLEMLSNHSGLHLSTIGHINGFYGTMSIEESKGLDIPEWGKPLKTDENFQYLYNMSFKCKTFTHDLRRLRTGPLAKFLLENIDRRVHNDSMKTKMVMLSGHDSTLVDALNTFEVLDLHRPGYSSVFMIELHQEDTAGGNFFVELYLRNDTSREPYKLKMPHCELQCPLEEFSGFVKPIIPEDWEAECKLTQPNGSQSTILTYIWVGLCIGPAVIFMLGLVCLSLLKTRRNIVQRNEYQKL